jgi:hypothetical protein
MYRLALWLWPFLQLALTWLLNVAATALAVFAAAWGVERLFHFLFFFDR